MLEPWVLTMEEVKNQNQSFYSHQCQEFQSQGKFTAEDQDRKYFALREGSQKKCKSVVFDQTGGRGHPKPNSYWKNNFFQKLTICPQTYPIHKEIVVSAVLVINSLCGDHFLIA